MLNEVVIEGYISGRPWTYAGDQFFRLGSYRDRQRPAKRTTENRDEPDYVTARLASNGLPVVLQSGARVRVHGYIQSRYYTEPLADWLKDARGPTNALSIGDELRGDITHNRIVTELVIEKLLILETPEAKQARAARKSVPVPEPVPDLT